MGYLSQTSIYILPLVSDVLGTCELFLLSTCSSLSSLSSLLSSSYVYYSKTDYLPFQSFFVQRTFPLLFWSNLSFTRRIVNVLSVFIKPTLLVKRKEDCERDWTTLIEKDYGWWGVFLQDPPLSFFIRF